MQNLLRIVVALLFSVVILVQSNRARGQSISQDQAPASMVRDLDQYRSQRLQEKIFVHTDKELYLIGEICWFKVYDVDATMHRPLELSKVAYLEWLDKNNKPVLQAKIDLQKGQGSGSVYLPLNLLSGNYTLRAYTAWMKNYGTNWFFEKKITVVNDRRTVSPVAAEASFKPIIAFFPEGGNLMENIPCKVAFRVADQYGNGIGCTGVVTEDDQDTVVSFHTLHFGIGSFVLTPRPNHRYRATIRLADGTAINSLLPVAFKEGMAMHVSGEGAGRLRVDLHSAAAAVSGPMADGSVVYLIADTRQSVKFAGASILKEGKCSFLLDKDSLGEGISHLTVFDAGRRPVCERLVFKNPSHRLRIAMNADKQAYATREKISLRVSPATADDRPVNADCSLSVFRMDSILQMSPQHIESYLWLSSDLGNGIESPEYYFDHPEDEEAMDNLMMTHGWSRFRWEDVLRHPAPFFEFAPEYKGAIVSGRIIDQRTGKLASGIEAYLSMPGTRTQFTSGISDENGLVKFEMTDFYGGREIIVQTNPLTDSAYNIDIANPFSDAHATTSPGSFFPPAKYPQTLSDRSVAVQVLNRFGREKLHQFYPPPVDTSTFYYKADESYLLDDYTRFTTMEEVLREYVRLILVQRKGGHFHLPVYDLANRTSFESDPLILLDGVPIFDIDSLISLDPLKFRRLDVMHRKYFLGAASFNGILNWVTYKGDLGGYILDPHATVVDYEGLQLQREFYSPSYATGQEHASHLPDFRNVLYWSPSVTLDATRKGIVNFYSSDLPGKYVVMAEGLAPDGTAGSGFTEFEVK